MKVIMFQPRFAALVESGNKTQTIRPTRKRPLQVGESVSLRKWSGVPYRSPQIELRTAWIVGVVPVKLEQYRADMMITVNTYTLYSDQACAFAWADGFPHLASMFDWFEATHGLPFVGQLIRWQ